MSKKLKVMIAAILILTCVVAMVHINNQEDISCMLIRYDAHEFTVTFDDLCKSDFSGQTVNGKGDISVHEYTGILLRELLASKGIVLSEISSVTVMSADNYSASYTQEEILSDSSVYAAVKKNGGLIEGIDPGTVGVQIVVFGDNDSRRCIRYAVIIECI